jgi:hypothetical protein
VAWKFKPRWGESDLTFSVYNAYDRRNAYFVYYEEIRSNNDTVIESIQSKQVSLFPVIPTLTYNFKF